jgi:hypothetical protein
VELIGLHRPARAITDGGCLLSSQSGLPTGRLGEAVMAHGIDVIADVVDPVRAQQCGEERSARILSVQMSVVDVRGRRRSGLRSIQGTEAQGDAATSRVSEAAKLAFSFQRGAQVDRHIC